VPAKAEPLSLNAIVRKTATSNGVAWRKTRLDALEVKLNRRAAKMSEAIAALVKA
jgi:hypothetical protein